MRGEREEQVELQDLCPDCIMIVILGFLCFVPHKQTWPGIEILFLHAVAERQSTFRGEEFC